jgi:hypothetical protein
MMSDHWPGQFIVLQVQPETRAGRGRGAQSLGHEFWIITGTNDDDTQPISKSGIDYLMII